MHDPYDDFRHLELPNGLTIYALHTPNLSFEVTHFIVHAGSYVESVERPGVAHFLEHVVCGTSGRTVAELDKLFKDEGGDFFANTDGKRTQYGFIAPIASSRFQEFVDLFGTAILNPKIEHVLERERAAILSEFGNVYQSEKDISFKLEVNAALYPGTSFATKLSTVGTKESVSSLSAADLNEFHRMHYVPRNITVVCAGGLSMDKIVAMLKHAGFANETENNIAPSRMRIQMPAAPLKTVVEGNFFTGDSSTNNSCDLAWLVNSDHIPMTLYTEILTQLLMDELRGNKKSIVYGTYATMQNFEDFFALFAIAENFPPEYESLVLEVMQEQVDAVSQYESLFATNRKARLLAFSVRDENIRGITESAVATLLKYGCLKSLRGLMDDIELVTFDDILNIVRQVRLERRLCVIERR